MKIECRNRLYAAAAVAVLGLLAIGSTQARVLSQWVELGPDGRRACGRSPTMPVRRWCSTARRRPWRCAPSRTDVRQCQAGAAFPVRGCEVAVPPEGGRRRARRQAAAAGAAEPAAHPDFRRHRLPVRAGRSTQDCNDPRAWPFPKIAAAAATARPDW